MTVSLPTSPSPDYAVSEKALRRWAAERVRCQSRADGGRVYTFVMSGSTCTNMGVPLEVVMTVTVGTDGRIESTSSEPAPGDSGCDAMCAAACDGRRFLAEAGGCEEATGLTLREAAFRDWGVEPSGCFCTAGNRRHKWRNAFQTLDYAATHSGG